MNGDLHLVSSFASAFNNESREFSRVRPIICPPFTLLHSSFNNIPSKYIDIGAQNCSSFDFGSFTGEISAKMLSEMGCKYVIIGHSERRKMFLETEKSILEKVEMAIKYNLIPIVCIGESKSENRLEVIDRSCSSLPNNIVIAYEPIWSIGTGVTPDPMDVCIVVTHIKSIISKCKVLYGGSVDDKNAASFITTGKTDGLLVGNASLNPVKFINILRIIDSIAGS